MQKYKIALVSYLNSKPFLYGLKNYSFQSPIEFSVNTPAAIANQLLNNEVDLALVPVAILNEMKEYFMLPDFCIGCNGEVQSVSLFSEIPIQKCKSVLLDYQSRTSVMLAKILLEKHWKLNPEFVSTSEGYEQKIKGVTAGLVIGDRALQLKNKFPFVYDLGMEWKKFTNLPFVFAVWASAKKIPNEISSELKAAFESGMNSMSEVIAEEQINYLGIDVKDYLTNGISFQLNEEKLIGMKLFLQLIQEYEIKTV